jgi:hypothetical protein
MRACINFTFNPSACYTLQRTVDSRNKNLLRARLTTVQRRIGHRRRIAILDHPGEIGSIMRMKLKCTDKPNICLCETAVYVRALHNWQETVIRHMLCDVQYYPYSIRNEMETISVTLLPIHITRPRTYIVDS